jgi:hypothetical protein
MILSWLQLAMCKLETKYRPQASSTRLAVKLIACFAVNVKHMKLREVCYSVVLARVAFVACLREASIKGRHRGRSAAIKPFPMPTEAQRSRQYHDSVVMIYG